MTARRSSSDGRDVYYRADLHRCRDLLGDSAAALHPGAPPRADSSAPAPRAPARAPRVLFLCTGNSARSQMAEALLEHRSGGAVQARSAGSHPKPLHPDAVRVMAERGIDISGNTTKHLRRFARNRFDRVITLCDKVREVCPEFPGEPSHAALEHRRPGRRGANDDETYPAFERTADELEERVALLIAQLFAPQGGPTHAR